MEAILTRWGPEGIGKLGDPRWARPIKDAVRQTAQARAVNQVVAALHPTPSQVSPTEVNMPIGPGPLRVVNGMPSVSVTTTNTSVTAGRGSLRIEGLPSPRGTAWPGATPGSPNGAKGVIHENTEGSDTEIDTIKRAADLERRPTVNALPLSSPPLVPPKSRLIQPSLATLEKAASARIFFENLYFPLMRQPPSREQRRLAMEREMNEMGLKEERKDRVRDQWRRNETEYLREQRKRVHVSAFRELKIIGHGKFEFAAGEE